MDTDEREEIPCSPAYSRKLWSEDREYSLGNFAKNKK
jgi:hypothetical protein